MKNLRIAALLALPLAVSCGQEHTLTITNKSKTEFYVMTEKDAKYITEEKIYYMHSSGEIEHLGTMGTYTRTGTSDYLDKFKSDSGFVFCFVSEANLKKQLKGKERREYKTVTLPSKDAEHLTSVVIAVKDSLSKPVFESTVKYKTGI